MLSSSFVPVSKGFWYIRRLFRNLTSLDIVITYQIEIVNVLFPPLVFKMLLLTHNQYVSLRRFFGFVVVGAVTVVGGFVAWGLSWLWR